MKKRIALLLALALLAAMLCSCGGAKQNEETTTTEPTTTEAPLVWNEELQNKIRMTRAEQIREYDGKNATIEDVRIMKYYGIYNNAIPVVIMDKFSFYYDAVTYEKVGGVEFFHDDSNTIVVWKNNTLYTLQEAFDQRLLTRFDLLQIADIQNNNGGYFNQ